MSKRRVLVIGAGGFIGSRVVGLLLAHGHDVICAGRDIASLRRRFPSAGAVAADLSRDTADDWTQCLIGVDVVVNAAGVLRGDLEGIHHLGPVALFDACARAETGCVIQISALGAGSQNTRFLATKMTADHHLIRLAREKGLRRWCVLRPSLVVGRGGGSTALFSALAALPRPIRLGPGTWQVQPIHVADLARAVVALLDAEALPASLDVVGPDAITTDDLTHCLRGWLGLPARPFLPMPLPALRLAAAAGEWLPESSLTRESLGMLARGNTADMAPLDVVLGWRPQHLADALAMEPSVASDLWVARLLPIRVVIRLCLAVVWIGSGAASLLLKPESAASLLAGLGLSGPAAIGTTWAGAGLDIALGAALMHRQMRRPALLTQLGVMGVYTVLATVPLPRLWLDPFGSLLKNLAVLAATLALIAMEDRG